MQKYAAASAVIDLGRLALQFGRVNRITYHEDGVTRESDTDHTVMLGLVACAFASRYLPQLNIGRVAEFALVHDLVEAYAGDTPTLQISAEGKAAKEEREQAALGRIDDEFREQLPWLPITIAHYEHRLLPEARYVKAMDKLLPKITHLCNGLKTVREQGMSQDELAQRYEQQLDELKVYASDFPEIFGLREALVGLVMEFAKRLLPTAPGPAERCEKTDLLVNECAHCKGDDKPERATTGPVVTAYYESECNDCLGTMYEGDQITNHSDLGWVHAECAGVE